VLTGTVHGQVARPLSEDRPAAASATAFDIRAEQLPPNYSGHDIKAIYKELSSRGAGATKGEFETTEEFRTRVRQEASTPIYGGHRPDAYFAFKVTNTMGETFYDADRQVMTLAVALDNASKSFYRPSDKKSLSVEYDSKTDSYELSNVYGAKVPATLRFSNHHEIAFKNYKDFNVTRYLDSRSRRLGYTSDSFARDAILIELPMNVTTAKKVKKDLEILAVVKLVEPHTFGDTFGARPTVAEPGGMLAQFYYLNAVLSGLWVYDKTTGQIFIKVRP